MIVTLRSGADPEAIRRSLIARGLWVTRFENRSGQPLFLVRPGSGTLDPAELERIEGIESWAAPQTTHPLVDAALGMVQIGPVPIGPGWPPVLMAGPCAVESAEQITAAAARVAAAGGRFLRGGLFKPRTSPYDFPGHGREGLTWFTDAARTHGLLTVSEVLSESAVEPLAEAIDLLQVGSRNMHNAALLSSVGAARRPVLLKRGMAATLEELLLAGEYLLLHGAPAVLFCERGIRSFDTTTRNLLDLSAVAYLAHVKQLPVIVDPSHALGRKDLIRPMSRAALAAGAAGLMVETHDDPGRALSDGPQSLTPREFRDLAGDLGFSPGDAERR